MGKQIEVIISFDTTGSMYPCLTQVRRNVSVLVSNLFKQVSGIRIGAISHGDYCDARNPHSYVLKILDLSNDKQSICDFVLNVGPTDGGDSPECYELVLAEARTAHWTSGATKILILIGDDVPHSPHESQNTRKLDWRNELKLLLEAGVHVYAVQALGRRHATSFYKEVAKMTKGYHLELDQFRFVEELIYAVCFKQVGDDRLRQYEEEVTAAGRMNRGVYKIFSTMLDRDVSERYAPPDLEAVPPGRFQVLEVDEDVSIKDFVVDNGLTFKKGRGFYEFMKTETVQEEKEVVLMDNVTGDMFTGEKAREMIGLPYGMRGRIKPEKIGEFAVFVQSTSVNRKLIGGTKFLYEVDDWDR